MVTVIKKYDGSAGIEISVDVKSGTPLEDVLQALNDVLGDHTSVMFGIDHKLALFDQR